MKGLSDKKAKIILMIILIWGFMIRIIGYNWGGAGMIFNTDEFSVVEPVIHMVESHTLLHQVWVYPSMSSSKLIAIILMPFSIITHISRFEYYYAVRIAYTVFSTVIIAVSYRLVKDIEGTTTALLFAFVLSVNPSMIKYAKMAVGDTPVLMFWLFVAFFMSRYILDRRISYLLIMSFFAACSMLEKWNGAGITIFIAIGVILYNIRDIKKMVVHGALSSAAWILSLFIISPNIITSLSDMRSAIFEANPSLGSNPIYGQFKFFYSYSGIGAIILTITGLVVILSEKRILDMAEERRMSRFPYVFAVIGLIEDWELCEEQVERHGFAVQWVCILLIVIGFVYLFSIKKLWRYFAIISFALVACTLTLSSVLVDIVALRTREHDTRVVGARFLEDMGADIHNTIGDSYTPFAPPIGENVMDGVFEYDNMINDLLFFDENGAPCVSLPDKRFAITSNYKWARNKSGYAVLESENESMIEFNSDYDIDLQMNFRGCGIWYASELDTVREIINTIKQVSTSSTIGPSFRIYDISSFTYKERE